MHAASVADGSVDRDRNLASGRAQTLVQTTVSADPQITLRDLHLVANNSISNGDGRPLISVWCLRAYARQVSGADRLIDAEQQTHERDEVLLHERLRASKCE